MLISSAAMCCVMLAIITVFSSMLLGRSVQYSACLFSIGSSDTCQLTSPLYLYNISVNEICMQV